MALTGINQDRRRDAANIAHVKAFRDNDAEVFKAILRRIVGLAGADENVVTVAAVARSERREPIAPIITALALVEATGGDHSKRVGVFAGMRTFWRFKAPSVAGVQTVEDALAAVLYENDPH
jgi:hypothetical protein